MLSPALTNPIKKPESGCVPGNQTRESLAWESQEELNSREKWDVFSPSGDSNLAGMVAAPTSPFLPCSATDETFSFWTRLEPEPAPSSPLISIFLRSWDQLTKALPSFRGLKCALGRGGRSDGARWEKTLGSLAALWSLSRLQHSRAESRPPACDLKTSQSLQKTKILSPAQESSRERHTSWWD